MVKGLQRWLTQINRVLYAPHFWLILVLLIGCGILHYAEQFGIADKAPPSLHFGLTQYAFYRILFLVPIIYTGFVFRFVGGLIVLLIALFLMLPRALLISPSPPAALFETGIVILVGVLVNLWVRARAKQAEAAEQREQAIKAMVTAREKLRAQIRSTMQREKELTALSRLSSSLTESLEMKPLLSSAIGMVMEVMGVEVVLIYSLEEKTKELIVVAYEGVPPKFAQNVDRMRVGEGFNGQVAETGEPLLVEDASSDPRLTREAVRREKLQAQIIVPMKSRGRVVGTLCVAVRQYRKFAAWEIELLIAIASEIGIAIENARLYQEQLAAATQLEISEKRYKALFERAHDAIWVHDMDGNITSANEATAKLTGYEMEELSHMNVRALLSEESLRLAKEIRSKLLHGEPVVQPYEQRLTTKQGTEAILKLATNVVRFDGKPVSFEHIARDVTEERRMEENLRFYLQHITKAQEEERKRISRELHDSTAQTLIAILHQLEDFLQSKASFHMGDTRFLWRLHEEVRTVLQEVRQFSRDLRPSILDDLGLIPSLEWLCSETGKESGIDIKFQVVGSERRFYSEVELMLFRIIQEALRNVARHSSASQAQVTVAFNKQTTKVTIEDNGKGFALPETIADLSRLGKLGLAGMQERARLLGGNLKIESELDKGTKVIVEVPL